MPTLKAKVAEEGFPAHLERLGSDCPVQQFLREFVKNSIQAIERYRKINNQPDFKGIIEVDQDKTVLDLNSVSKICFIDNGIGMSGEEMIRYINELSKSSDIQATHENYGIGAKVSAAVRNKKGIYYQSWKKNIGEGCWFWYDPKIKYYGLKDVDIDGRYSHAWPLDDMIKPKIIQDHGTIVTLYGNSDESDTYSHLTYELQGAPEQTWVFSYLNQRFYKIPDNIEIRVRLNHKGPKTGKNHTYTQKLIGVKDTLDHFTVDEGEVDLGDAAVHWRILDKERKYHSTRDLGVGHTAVIHEDEVFNITKGMGNKAHVHFGIFIGYKHIVLHILPKNSSDYFQNSLRDKIIHRVDNDLPWESWGAAFKEKMPGKIKAFLDNAVDEETKSGTSISILKKLKELSQFYSLSKYKFSTYGDLKADEDDLTKNKFSDFSNTDNPNMATSKRIQGGDSEGVVDEIISLSQKSKGKTAIETSVNSFPEVKWIHPGDGIEVEEIRDRAAIYRINENIVFANLDFTGYLDLNEYYKKIFPKIKEDFIAKQIRDIFDQQFMEVIMACLSLKNRKYWNPNDFETAISSESLTAVVSPRLFFMEYINRRLKQFKQEDTE
jgi:hypothetical protein